MTSSQVIIITVYGISFFKQASKKYFNNIITGYYHGIWYIVFKQALKYIFLNAFSFEQTW